MSSPDFGRMEAQVSLLLRPGASTRAELLAALADYSAAAVRDARMHGSIVPAAGDCIRALEWLLRPVFICGHHRSGTTLLQNLLDGHPQLVCLPSEGTYFTSFAYVAKRSSGDRDLDRFAAEWICRFVDPNFEPHFRLGRSGENRAPAVDFARLLFGWHEALRRRVPGKLAPLLALAAAYWTTTAPMQAPRAWVEKTPLNERRVGRFAFFDAARFIQLVRDPRAVLASLEQVYRTGAPDRFDAAQSARSIGRSLQLAGSNARRLRGRYLVVRYEDLVNQPAGEIERVRRFLGIAADAALSLPTAGGRPVAANGSFGAKVAGTIEPARPPPVLPAEQLTLLGAHVGSAARSFGYDVPVPAPVASWAARARYWSRQTLRIGSALSVAGRRKRTV
jgi:hypothetical protein